MDEARRQQIDALLARLGLPPARDPHWFDQALTHSSYTYEHRHGVQENYERLEFLGDAVLKLFVSEYLFERFPDYREGDLTKIRAVVVSDATLAQLAQALSLTDAMVFGASEARSGGRQKLSNLACAFEAFLGALYMDGHMAEARAFLYQLMEDPITRVDQSKTKDNYKAALQELTQGEGLGLPHYRTIRETGPSHDRTFMVEVLVHHEVVGYGAGKSKKEAQQQAARMALMVLGNPSEEDETPASDIEAGV